MTYESLMPNEVVGYSTQPVELFGVAPAGATIKDLFPRDAQQGDYHTRPPSRTALISALSVCRRH